MPPGFTALTRDAEVRQREEDTFRAACREYGVSRGQVRDLARISGEPERAVLDAIRQLHLAGAAIPAASPRRILRQLTGRSR